MSSIILDSGQIYSKLLQKCHKFNHVAQLQHIRLKLGIDKGFYLTRRANRQHPHESFRDHKRVNKSDMLYYNT
jgi:hypothetical protein